MKRGVFTLLMLVICAHAPFNECYADSEKPGDKISMDKIFISQSDQGKMIEMYVGMLVIVRLSENPNTGYRWQIDNINNRIIKLIDSDFMPNSGASMGSGGIQTFTLRAQASGKMKLCLRLRREWEPRTKAIDSFEVIISVHNR